MCKDVYTYITTSFHLKPLEIFLQGCMCERDPPNRLGEFRSRVCVPRSRHDSTVVPFFSSPDSWISWALESLRFPRTAISPLTISKLPLCLYTRFGPCSPSPSYAQVDFIPWAFWGLPACVLFPLEMGCSSRCLLFPVFLKRRRIYSM